MRAARIRSVTVENFRSFRARQTLVFPGVPGLYFMQGVNEVDKSIEANGAGKSTIWEALTWALSNKTSRGLKAGDVANWDTGKCVLVNVEYEDELGSRHNLVRTWGPISCKLDGVDAPADVCEVVLGMSATSFLYTVSVAQEMPMFLDLKADAKAACFSDVLGLDVWLSYAERAGKMASEQDRKVRSAESLLARAEGGLAGLVADGLKSSSAEWGTARERDLDRMESEYDRALKSVDAAEVARTSASRAVEDLERGVATLESSTDQLKTNLSTFIDTVVHDGRVAVGVLKDRVASLTTPRSGVCPTCGQRVGSSPGHVADGELRKAKRELAAAEDKLAAAYESVDDMHVAVAQQTRVVQQRRADLAQVIRRKEEAGSTVQRAGAEADRIADAFTKRRDEVNPFLAMEEAAVQARDRAQKARDAARTDLSRLQERYALLALWVKGFKDLRLETISEGLAQLEIEVNNNLGRLGLSEWRVVFDVDSETAKGTVKRGFTVMVHSPRNSKPVPWEVWSGGESQRLRLAGTMGLADVARSVRGVGLDLEVWDEPTAGLSPQGVADLLQCLSARAVREGRQIWVVDHRSLSYGSFTGYATVRKTSNGSVIEQEF